MYSRHSTSQLTPHTLNLSSFSSPLSTPDRAYVPTSLLGLFPSPPLFPLFQLSRSVLFTFSPFAASLLVQTYSDSLLYHLSHTIYQFIFYLDSDSFELLFFDLSSSVDSAIQRLKTHTKIALRHHFTPPNHIYR